jgi:ABC-type transport system involved in cytochrome bd biosynthesis fused ATPase/permease subunit
LILVSHRFSTVRKADRICVFKAGIVEEQGSHDDLMRLGKMYARLFQSQAAGYQEEKCGPAAYDRSGLEDSSLQPSRRMG